MTAKNLEKLIHSQIPLSKKMGIRVERVSARAGVRFVLPLRPNKNHKNTAFGGTLVAAQALVSWAWLMTLLEEKKIQAEVVVQRQSSEFLHPVAQEFMAETVLVKPGDVRTFLSVLQRRGRARMTISAQIRVGQRILANYVGQYVAIAKHSDT